MQATTLVSVQEYLTTDYEPDCDYVDGVLEERNVGRRKHGQVQGRIYAFYLQRQEQSRLYPFIEQRLQVSATRYRLPDVCLVFGRVPGEDVFTEPPLAVIEVLSPEDRMSRVQQRIDDYLQFGVRYVWVIDPELRRAWTYTAEGAVEAKDLILRLDDPRVELPLKEIFAAIDADAQP